MAVTADERGAVMPFVPSLVLGLQRWCASRNSPGSSMHMREWLDDVSRLAIDDHVLPCLSSVCMPVRRAPLPPTHRRPLSMRKPRPRARPCPHAACRGLPKVGGAYQLALVHWARPYAASHSVHPRAAVPCPCPWRAVLDWPSLAKTGKLKSLTIIELKVGLTCCTALPVHCCTRAQTRSSAPSWVWPPQSSPRVVPADGRLYMSGTTARACACPGCTAAFLPPPSPPTHARRPVPLPCLPMPCAVPYRAVRQVYLARHELKQSGNKDVLVERIKEHLGVL